MKESGIKILHKMQEIRCMKPEIFAGCSYRGKDKEKIADKFGDFSTVVSPDFA